MIRRKIQTEREIEKRERGSQRVIVCEKQRVSERENSESDLKCV